MPILVFAAIIPIVALCCFIYFKDKNKEPHGLLAGIFFAGLGIVFPVIIVELLFGIFFEIDSSESFLMVFINVFMSVALVEEGFKWLVTKLLGYNNKEFDEVFDVIVYAVFASLGFACFENILYVVQNGLGNAVMRALLAVPGHTCFAISMGYFFSKAKVSQISGNQGLYSKNMALSIIAPIILHTFYDAFLFYAGGGANNGTYVLRMVFFFVFYIIMVIVCFLTVDKVAKVQQNLTTNLNNGSIKRDDQGYLYYNYQQVVQSNAPANQPVMQAAVSQPSPVVSNATVDTSSNGAFPDTPVSIPSPTIPTPVEEASSVAVSPVGPTELKFCPICGKQATGTNFCGRCGFRLK